MNTGLSNIMKLTTVDNSIFSIFSDIWKAKELVLYKSFSISIEVDIWLTFDKQHYLTIMGAKIVAFASLREADQSKKVLWIAKIALEFENYGNERQSRLQEYAENVLESWLDNISGSNLSKGMTKASLTWLVTCKNLSAVCLCQLPLLQLRCLEDTLTTSLATL